jgi:hypothetical protein
MEKLEIAMLLVATIISDRFFLGASPDDDLLKLPLTVQESFS